MSLSTVRDKEIALQVVEKFKAVFGVAPVVVRSPGRVNLIGEHTDYNDGFVLPAAIDKAIYMAVSPREDRELHFVSQDLDRTYKGNVDRLEKDGQHWPDYLLGVIGQLQGSGRNPTGFNCVFGGDIPPGAGLSSSAALECATIFALNHLFGWGITPTEMVKLAQRAENEFVGVQCGIMDQFASMFGKKGHAIRLDCRSLDYRYVPLNMEGIKIVLLDTAVKHSLASSEYNTRRKQCEAGVKILQAHQDNIRNLRDVTVAMLDKWVAPADPLIYRRCKYVVEENARLLDACVDLEKNDMRAFGRRMFGSHEGLSREYEVSCPELDFLVEQVKTEPAVLGARMMGGGFGGCTINLVREEGIERLVEKISAVYSQNMGKELKVYIARIEGGTSLL